MNSGLQRQPPDLTRGTWRAPSEHFSHGLLNFEEHCAPTATNEPRVSSGWVVEELKPFQLPGAAARNQSSRVPAITSFASLVPHVSPGSGRPHPATEPASQEVWRVDEGLYITGEQLPPIVGPKAKQVQVFQASQGAPTRTSSNLSGIPSTGFSTVQRVAPGTGITNEEQDAPRPRQLREEEDMASEEYYPLKPAYFSEETWRKLPDDIKKRYGNVEKDGSVNEKKGVSTGEEEPMVVESIEVIRPQESESECPLAPEYMLPDNWEASESGGPDQPEEPASREEQRDETQDMNIVPLHSLFLACENCGDLFSTQYNLEMHTQQKHWDSTQGIRRCRHCTYTSSRKVDITRHERTHVGRRESVCHLCQKRFSQPDHLKVHMMIHSGEKPYECGQCGKRFRQRVHARRHEQVIHSRRYPLHCPRCGAGAEDVTKLRRHTCKPLGATEGTEGFQRGRGRPRLRADGSAPTVGLRNTTEGAPLEGGVKKGRR